MRVPIAAADEPLVAADPGRSVAPVPGAGDLVIAHSIHGAAAVHRGVVAAQRYRIAAPHQAGAGDAVLVGLAAGRVQVEAVLTLAADAAIRCAEVLIVAVGVGVAAARDWGDDAPAVGEATGVSGAVIAVVAVDVLGAATELPGVLAAAALEIAAVLRAAVAISAVRGLVTAARDVGRATGVGLWIAGLHRAGISVIWAVEIRAAAARLRQVVANTAAGVTQVNGAELVVIAVEVARAVRNDNADVCLSDAHHRGAARGVQAITVVEAAARGGRVKTAPVGVADVSGAGVVVLTVAILHAARCNGGVQAAIGLQITGVLGAAVPVCALSVALATARDQAVSAPVVEQIAAAHGAGFSFSQSVSLVQQPAIAVWVQVMLELSQRSAVQRS